MKQIKQHITKEQYGELDDKKKEILLSTLGIYWSSTEHFGELSIGQMIEFLGDDLKIIDNYNDDELWQVFVGLDENKPSKYTENKELCDALLEAVKKKLKPNCQRCMTGTCSKHKLK